MNEAEIDAQWKLEKQKRAQALIDLIKTAQQERLNRIAQDGKEGIERSDRTKNDLER